ncbi:MAG: ArsC/Spx/MgsR family protein [Pseudomonadota bacterium]
MKLYGIKACDTCRAARAALEAAGHTVEFVDVRSEPLAPEQIERFFAALGEALVNRRSTTWRGLGDDERGESPPALLARHPTLMKRPVIDAGGSLYLGWGAEVRGVLL